MLRAIVNKAALRHNLGVLRGLAPQSRVFAVIKANGYGHGLVDVAFALDGADAFAVARIDEAVALYEAGVRKKILVLEGVYSRTDSDLALKLHLQLVVHRASQLDYLEQRADLSGSCIWIKIDSGLNRLGFRIDQIDFIQQRVESLRKRGCKVNFLSHFASADEIGNSMADLQLAALLSISGKFRKALPATANRCRSLPSPSEQELSIANSAGVFRMRNAQLDWIRPGISLYGISPFGDSAGKDLALIPAMTLESQVLSVRLVAPGEGVGYGSTWRATRDSRIAIVAGGYGDGIPRGISPDTEILIDGIPARLAGRVSMDKLAVDVTGHPTVSEASNVVVWGPESPVERFAKWANTIPYEVVCGLTERVPRVFV